MPEQSLDSTVEKSDWKQWLPIYGIFQVNLDARRDKPTIITRSMAYFVGSSAYQGTSVVALGLAAMELAKRLF